MSEIPVTVTTLKDYAHLKPGDRYVWPGCGSKWWHARARGLDTDAIPNDFLAYLEIPLGDEESLSLVDLLSRHGSVKV